MKQAIKDQWTTQQYAQEAYLPTWIESFIRDRKSQKMAKGTIYFYEKKLALFAKFCESRAITQITDITPDDLRLYLLQLEQTGHNSGGIHCAYRALRTFLYWWEEEIEPEDWKNPIRKVKAPKIPEEPLEPIEQDKVQKLIETCNPGTFTGVRDKAIFLTLLDTGVRASELVALDLEDFNITDGSILVRLGKGGKTRVSFTGKQSRKAIRKWIKFRSTQKGPLFTTEEGERLTYWGLRQIIRRHADKAGIPEPGAHDFRRAFCLAQLNAKVPETIIARLMGHKDTSLIKRYAKQSKTDLLENFRSTVDEDL